MSLRPVDQAMLAAYMPKKTLEAVQEETREAGTVLPAAEKGGAVVADLATDLLMEERGVTDKTISRETRDAGGATSEFTMAGLQLFQELAKRKGKIPLPDGVLPPNDGK